MRIAALYDIHGNLPALEAVLADIKQISVDLIVVGGDVVSGPMPRATLERLLGLSTPVRFLRGNGDREVVEHAAGSSNESLPNHIQLIVEWVAQQLLPEQIAAITAWPATHTLDIPGLGPVLFCHATPRSDTRVFTRLTATQRIAPEFANVQAPIVVCGHTHMPFDRTIATTRVLNAGSVGMPYGEPGAHWLLLGPSIEFKCTSYSLLEAAQQVRATSYPMAEDFAVTNILDVPTEAEALEVFTNMEL